MDSLHENTQVNRLHPKGLSAHHERALLVCASIYDAKSQLAVYAETEEQEFRKVENLHILNTAGKALDLAELHDFRISEILHQQVMTFTRHSGRLQQLHVAVRHELDDVVTWETTKLKPALHGQGMIVPELRIHGQYVMFTSDKGIGVWFSKDLISWYKPDAGHLHSRPSHFDSAPLTIIASHVIEQGILVLYQSSRAHRSGQEISVGAALYHKQHPERLIWRSDDPLWQTQVAKPDQLKLLGAVITQDQFLISWQNAKQRIVSLALTSPFAGKPHRGMSLHRYDGNPILSPTIQEWESEAVFNPAAFVDNGRVHLLYRAMGADGVSRIGYASSPDGIHFDERLTYPVYTPQKGFGSPSTGRQKHNFGYDIIANPSGGGWAGCEDPRVVTVDGHAYMSYVAFDGWDFVRMALTAISLDDFNDKNWQWRQPVLISKPGEIQKNWVIFPEKVNGKYAIIHGLSPKIHIEYLDSLEELDGENFMNSLPSHGGAGYQDSSRQQHWDNRVRGAGAPPIKTPMGWLLLYHATDMRDPGKYKLGAMLLDLDDPSKILMRTSQPILQPEEWYENDGKPGVIYTCGAVVVNENLVVYYGAGDKHIAVARANVKRFLEAMSANEAITLTPVRL